MNENMRKALYALVPVVVLLLTTYGVLNQQQGVLWVNVLTMAIGFAYAASKATGSKWLDSSVRRAVYVLIPAVASLVGGYFSIDVGMWTSVALAILGAVFALANIDPDEQAQLAA